MKDFLKTFGIWFDVGFIIFTLFMLVVKGFSFDYLLYLACEVIFLVFHLTEENK